MFVYVSDTVSVAQNFATSGSANTDVDQVFIKPGTRTIGILSLWAGGKASGATTLAGIAYRLKKWTTTASSAGTAIVPTPKDPGAQACKATAGGASAGVTSGTGGPTLLGGCVGGVGGGASWVAPNEDSCPKLEGSATQSIDLFSASAATGLNFEAKIEHTE